MQRSVCDYSFDRGVRILFDCDPLTSAMVDEALMNLHTPSTKVRMPHSKRMRVEEKSTQPLLTEEEVSMFGRAVGRSARLRNDCPEAYGFLTRRHNEMMIAAKQFTRGGQQLPTPLE